MKKYITTLASLSLVLGLAACAKTEVKEPEATPDASAPAETAGAEATPEATDAPESDATVFTLSGEVTEPLVVNEEGNVEIILDNVSADMEGSVISIENAASAKITLVGKSTLNASGEEPKAIASNADLVIGGEGVLAVVSSDTCIKSEGNLTIESGTYELTAGADGDGLRANETLTINDGMFVVSAGECLEGTEVLINGGTFELSASDDAINASAKSETLSPKFIINDGTVTITMNGEDSDAIDSNGDIEINGGTIEITGQSAFDWDGNLSKNGGTVIINGEEVEEINNQFKMGGFMPGGMKGERPEGERPEMPEGERPEGPDGQHHEGEVPPEKPGN